MPQVISTQLLTRMQQGVTTLCQLLEITRRDGQVFRFSTATRDKTFDGNLFKAGGFEPTDVSSTFDEGIGDLNVTCYFTEDLTELDVRTGKFDNAIAKLFVGDWTFPEYGTVTRFTGIVNSSMVTNDGAANFQLLGSMALAIRSLGEIRSPNCRAIFGDTRCKFPIMDHRRKARVIGWNGKELLLDFDWNGVGGDPNPQNPSAHTRWRAKMRGRRKGQQGTRGYIKLAEMELRTVVGGSNACDPGMNGEIIASENVVGAANVFDSDPNTYWASYNIADQWVGFEFTAPIVIAELSLTVWQSITDVPVYVALEYYDEIELEWVPVIGTAETFDELVNGQVWAAGETKVFARTTGTYEASFQGGMIEFIDGENAGGLYDIVLYEEATIGFPVVRLAITPTRFVEEETLVWVYPGCNKTLGRCRYWNNVVNYRGEPYVPTSTYQGQNRLLQ